MAVERELCHVVNVSVAMPQSSVHSARFEVVVVWIGLHDRRAFALVDVVMESLPVARGFEVGVVNGSAWVLDVESSFISTAPFGLPLDECVSV